MRLDIDVPLRGWNCGPAKPDQQVLRFNPKAVHDCIDREIRAITRGLGWSVEKSTFQTGGAFKPRSWFLKPRYTEEIENGLSVEALS